VKPGRRWASWGTQQRKLLCYRICRCHCNCS
jgi:hypothetical protein